ncbi:Putative 115 kDa protein in type-1 retrotransposable element R1DM [Eumeta japonica]|uniref:115 kDa protein in type-1 retrotransposable element R1DM n=1 Tax=Eumeta variegata TaxID=151549 RepID=A0A4C2AEE0_EUMVA|nr:Putative 115 kDa protein in type-1 retrotransposable element R1DM [Eumeta japonica]
MVYARGACVQSLYGQSVCVHEQIASGMQPEIKNLKPFDEKLKACKKATNVYKRIARAARVTWGLNPEIVRTIYVAVIESMLLYAVCAWALATGRLGVQKRLNAIQRSMAIKTHWTYRTVSFISVLILSRLLPIDIRVREVAWFYEVKHGKELGDISADRKLEKSVGFCELSHPRRASDIQLQERQESGLRNNISPRHERALHVHRRKPYPRKSHCGLH